MILALSDEAVAQAADALRAGQLVAFATETVYGLGADAGNAGALIRLYEAKGRPRCKPLPVLVGTIEAARRLIVFDRRIDILCRSFWPGPLTIVGRRCPDCPVQAMASAGGETLAVRVPDHAPARALIATFGGPIAAPSANISGAPSPTTAADVATGLGTAVAVIIDGGRCRLGIASTVVRVDETGVELLRAGAIDRSRIETVVGALIPAQELGR